MQQVVGLFLIKNIIIVISTCIIYNSISLEKENHMKSLLFVSSALAIVAHQGIAQPSFPDDPLQIYWCNSQDNTQQFTLKADGTIRTPNNLCIENVNNNTIQLNTCTTGSSIQTWTYSGNMIQQSGYCWNLQSDQSYMYPNASVKLWSCTPPNWNDYFTFTNNNLISVNFTSANNNTPTDLCVQSLHTVPPMPTADVVAWHESEIACFIHFNMATMAGSQGCGGGAPPNISLWQPSALNTDQWIQTCTSMGGVRAIYTAKHGCGYLAWKSNISTDLYQYTVNFAPPPYNNIDVVDSFVQSTRKYGIGHGFYYSTVSNAYCNVENGVVQPGPINPALQINVTQEQYDTLVISHLGEIWGTWGPAAEVWFDGGYNEVLSPALKALFAELQPHVVAFQAEGLMPSPIRWVGTESGFSPTETWSTCDYSSYGAGSPNAATWFPAETDFTLQNGDNWFYNPSSGVHSPQQLRAMYEQSVGHNTAIIVDIAPYPNGTVPAEQVQAAALLGQYITNCYKSTPLASVTNVSSYTVTLTPSQGTSMTIDRLIVAEDQLAGGQRIRAYTITGLLSNGNTVSLSSGQSVGNKRIDILSSPVTVTSVTLNVTTAINTPIIRYFQTRACASMGDEIDQQWIQWTKDNNYVAPTFTETSDKPRTPPLHRMRYMNKQA